MPAPFAASVAGLRKSNGNPNTSDNNDAQSKQLGHELMRQLGVPATKVGPPKPGVLLEELTVADLRSYRPDLFIDRGQPSAEFAQYAHLGVYPRFKKKYKGPHEAITRINNAIAGMDPSQQLNVSRAAKSAGLALSKDATLVDELLGMMPEESMLKVDVIVGSPAVSGLPLLELALSAKWSLRTDRAQDCVSQGSKLVSLRRGRMPHFAVLTIEPRPAMLKILADGSGAVDCVYHLDLAALQRTIDACAARTKNPSSWSPKLTFDRLIRQGRLRDYDDLIAEVLRLPKAPPIQRATISSP